MRKALVVVFAAMICVTMMPAAVFAEDAVDTQKTVSSVNEEQPVTTGGDQSETVQQSGTDVSQSQTGGTETAQSTVSGGTTAEQNGTAQSTADLSSGSSGTQKTLKTRATRSQARKKQTLKNDPAGGAGGEGNGENNENKGEEKTPKFRIQFGSGGWINSSSTYYAEDSRYYSSYIYVSLVDPEKYNELHKYELTGVTADKGDFIKVSPSWKPYGEDNNWGYLYYYMRFDFKQFDHLAAESDNTCTVTATLRNKTSGEVYTATGTFTVIKSETRAPILCSDGNIGSIYYSDTCADRLELSDDGESDWHAPNADEAELIDGRWKLKKGYNGYARYKESDYEKESAVTPVNYYGNINNVIWHSEGKIHIGKKWYGEESSDTVTVEISYKIIAPRAMAPRPRIKRRASIKKNGGAEETRTVVVSDKCSYTVTKLNTWNDYKVVIRQVITKGDNWAAEVTFPSVEEMRTATGFPVPYVEGTGGSEFTITEVGSDSSNRITGEIGDDGSGSFEITNVGFTHVDVNKVWNDENDKDGLRPDSVTVELLADGEPTGKTLTLDAAGGWKGTFTGLLKGYYKKGANEPTEINYTVKEVSVANYESKVTGTAADGFTITNTHEPKQDPTVVITKPREITVGDPPVRKTITGDTPSEDATFEFTMKAAPEKSTLPAGMTAMPMPKAAGGAQSMTIAVKGAGSGEFGDRTFTKPGTYVYEVTEKNTGDENYEYDDTVYEVRYDVKSAGGDSLTCERTILKDGVEQSEMVFAFNNKYTAKDGDDGDDDGDDEGRVIDDGDGAAARGGDGTTVEPDSENIDRTVDRTQEPASPPVHRRSEPAFRPVSYRVSFGPKTGDTDDVVNQILIVAGSMLGILALGLIRRRSQAEGRK